MRTPSLSTDRSKGAAAGPLAAAWGNIKVSFPLMELSAIIGWTRPGARDALQDDPDRAIFLPLRGFRTLCGVRDADQALSAPCA